MVKRNQLFTVSQNKIHQTMPVRTKKGKWFLGLLFVLWKFLLRSIAKTFQIALHLRGNYIKGKMKITENKLENILG